MNSAAVLSVENLACEYNHKPVLRDVNFSLQPGEVLSILGANGAGKSTLLKAILGLHAFASGRICLSGKNVATISDKERARHIGFVPQAHALTFPFRVVDVVVMGLAPSLGFFQIPGVVQQEQASVALARLGIAHLANASFDQLSGGQQHLVLIARAIVAHPKILLLDEPTANLDLGNVAIVMQQLLQLAGEGMAIVMSTHHPEQAFLFSQRHKQSSVLALHQNGQSLFGHADHLLDEAGLQGIYGCEISVHTSLHNGHTVQFCMPRI